MLAAVLCVPGEPLQVRAVEVQPPQVGEVLVRVHAAGICHGDLHYIRGDLVGPVPFIPGHEGAGVVEAVGTGVSTVRAGDSVTFVPAHCGRCFYCVRGRPLFCEAETRPELKWRMRDGTTRFRCDGQEINHFSGVSCFAEYTVVPERALLQIPADISMEVAAMLGCAVTTGMGAVLFAAGVQLGDSVLIVGPGGVGLSAVQAARFSCIGVGLCSDNDPTPR